MKKVIVAAFLLLVGSFGCGKNFEWLPYINITSHNGFGGYSAVYTVAAITDAPATSTVKALTVGGGTIYAVDTANNRVLRYNATNGSYIGRFIGSGGSTLTNVGGIAYETQTGRVYVADYPNTNITSPGRILAFTSAGDLEGNLGGFSTAFRHLYGLAVTTGNNPILNILDADLLKITQYSMAQITAPAFVREWTGLNAMSSPRSIAVDSSGNVYVADTGNNRIIKFNNSGGGDFVFPGSGDTILGNPQGVAVGSDVYVADTDKNRVVIFGTDGTYKSVLTGNSRSQFSSPTGIAVDGTGALYVSDANGRIQKFVKK